MTESQQNLVSKLIQIVLTALMSAAAVIFGGKVI